MRLFEVTSDLNSIRSKLSVEQGVVNNLPPGHRYASIPFANLNDILEKNGIGTPAALIAVKDQIDPTGDVIDRIEDNGTIILKTKDKNPNKVKAIDTDQGSPDIDQMASNAARAAISQKK